MWKSHKTFTVTRHPKDNKSKSITSLFLVKIIAKLERTQRNEYQNKDQHRTLTNNLHSLHRVLVRIHNYAMQNYAPICTQQVSGYDQEMPQLQTVDQRRDTEHRQPQKQLK